MKKILILMLLCILFAKMTLSFEVTGTFYVSDTTPPIFTNLNNQTIVYNQVLAYDIDATDPSGISCFNINDTTYFSINCSGYLTNIVTPPIGIYWLNISVTDSFNNTAYGIIYVNVTAMQWFSTSVPQGVFEPISSLSGTHVNEFKIRFNNLTISPADSLNCYILESDRSVLKINATGLSLTNQSYNLSYTVQSGDSIINDPNVGYIPWIVKNCTIERGAMLIQNFNISQNGLSPRIYVHSPNYWEDSEITRAVACEGTPNVYFNNTAKCSFTYDTLFALQMRNGNPVDPKCFNSDGSGVDCNSNYCKGIYFPLCKNLDYFGGMSPLTDDPNGYTAFSVNFASYNTPIAYTRYINSSGSFKLRLTQLLSSKTFSITIYNLTNVSAANVYGSNLGGGSTSITNNGDGTWNVAYNRLSSGFTGNLDLTFNISFNSAINQNRNLKIVLAYGTDTNQGNPAYFDTNFSTSYGLKNNDESEKTSATNDLNGPCGDNVNNDFNYLSGSFDNSYDCYDSNCNGFLGALQNNDIANNKSGLCNYATETNCTDKYNNEYDPYTDCHDSDCFHIDPACPQIELICNDSINNDWDYALSSSNMSSSQKLDNNGTKWDSTHQFDVTDCLDADCNNLVGESSGQLCSFRYETNCSDGFNNDAMQLKDCDLRAVANSITMPNPDNAEYDCRSYCRASNTSQELGQQCFDNLDNDWDSITIIGSYSDQYTINSTGGIDCRWGGYFSMGSNYYPDLDCDDQINSAGKQCQLMREINCTDSFDNDFDHDASAMPRPGWNALSYNSYLGTFGLNFSAYADLDDYDCRSDPSVPLNESLNASWCFDGIDNNLDAYYFDGATYLLNISTGTDCSDPTCWGIVNPADPSQSCLRQEYNSTDLFFQNLAWPGMYCADGLDNDANGDTDCLDLSCSKQFDMCSKGPCWDQENISWNSCSDKSDNDYNGLTDCAETNCLGMIGNLSGALCSATENTNLACSDGLDNDANRSIDCADINCADKTGAIINGQPVYCRTSESTISDCFDGFDNNRNGLTDCMDPSCNSVCNLTTISGTSPITLPYYSGQISLNGISTSVAVINTSTQQLRKGQWYNITLRGISNSGTAQWTLGTALGGKFNKTSFNASTAYLSGAYSSTFGMTETSNGWVIDSLSSHASGYSITFNIKSLDMMPNDNSAYSNYEVTFAESQGSLTSLNNNITYAIRENIIPNVQSIQVIPNDGKVPYGSTIYIVANVSDNYQLGLCSFNVFNGTSYNRFNSTACTGSFVPTFEGNYYINLTPIDYYSNIGNQASVIYNADIVPTSASVSLDKSIPFYNQSIESVAINATFNVISTDTLGNCNVIVINSSGTEFSLGNFLASGKSCYSNNLDISTLSDGEYKLKVIVNETTDNDIIESKTTALFICSDISAGICRFADFNSDNRPDICSPFDIGTIQVSLDNPDDNAIINISTVTFNCSTTTNNSLISNLTLRIWPNFNSGNTYTNTKYLSGQSNQTSWNYTFTAKGQYIWNCLGYNNKGNSNWSTNRTFNVSFTTGGGGGGGGAGTCNSKWVCDDWSDCPNNGIQTRTCYDRNNCDNPSDQPETERSCECEEHWACTEWTPKSCDEKQVKTRICNDLSRCGTHKNQPQTTISCSHIQEDVINALVEFPTQMTNINPFLSPVIGWKQPFLWLYILLILLALVILSLVYIGIEDGIAASMRFFSNKYQELFLRKYIAKHLRYRKSSKIKKEILESGWNKQRIDKVLKKIKKNGKKK